MCAWRRQARVLKAEPTTLTCYSIPPSSVDFAGFAFTFTLDLETP